MIQHVRRSPSIVLATLGSALLAAFFGGIIASRSMPGAFELAFGLVPFFVLATVLSLVAYRFLGLDTETAQLATARSLMLAAVAAGLVALIGYWNNLSAVLLPRPALFSILTLGIWPFGEGPLAAVRFIPVIVAVSVFWVARKAGKDEVRAALIALAVYAAQAFATYALSWIVWATYAFGSGDILENVQDAFRIFVASNVNGYWTNGQVERFLASTGAQAETAMLAVQGATIYVLAMGVLAGFWLPWKRLVAVCKEAIGLTQVRQALALTLGLVVGVSIRMDKAATTDIVAWLLFLLASVGWLTAWTLEERFAEDSSIYLALAAGAACLLGWPVLMGFAVADLMRRLLLKAQAWSGMGVSVLYEACMAFALLWAGLAFGLRDLPVSGWMLSLIAAAAVLIAGAWLGDKLLRSALAIRWQALYVVGVAALSVLISGQIWFLILLLVLAGVAVYAQSQERLWDMLKIYLLDAFFGALLLLSLLAPKLLVH